MDVIMSVSDILRKASKDVEGITGTPIIAFFLQKPDHSTRLSHNVENLQKAVANVFGVDFKQLAKKNRKEVYVVARQIFIWFAMERMGLSSVRLAQMFNQNHATVLYSKQKVNDYLSIGDVRTAEQIKLVETYMEMEKELI